MSLSTVTIQLVLCQIPQEHKLLQGAMGTLGWWRGHFRQMCLCFTAACFHLTHTAVSSDTEDLAGSGAACLISDYVSSPSTGLWFNLSLEKNRHRFMHSRVREGVWVSALEVHSDVVTAWGWFLLNIAELTHILSLTLLLLLLCSDYRKMCLKRFLRYGIIDNKCLFLNLFIYFYNFIVHSHSNQNSPSHPFSSHLPSGSSPSTPPTS